MQLPKYIGTTTSHCLKSVTIYSVIVRASSFPTVYLRREESPAVTGRPTTAGAVIRHHCLVAQHLQNINAC